MVKKNGENSMLGFHQDWTFSDDYNYPALNLWVTLSDLTNNNGPLKIIPKSHKIKTPIRARNLKSDLEKIPDFVLNYFSKKLLLKKGDAVFFHENLIHASDNNLSNEIRLAVSLVLHHANTNLIHYIYSNNSLRKKNVNYSFFTENSLQEDFKKDESFTIEVNTNTKHLLLNLLYNKFK
jgi:ectoine hydroxylase-related dioxygenase (phytanoyl-CoA dioxygenase family)